MGGLRARLGVMTDSHWPGTRGARIAWSPGGTTALLAGGLAAAVIIAAFCVPRAAMTFYGVLGCVALVRYAQLGGAWRDLLRPDPIATPVFLVGLWALVSATWSPAPLVSLEAGAIFCGNILLTWLIARWLALEPAAHAEALRRGILIGAAIGLGLVLFEMLSEQAIRRFLLNAIPVLRPEQMHYLDMKGDTITRIRFHQLNRHAAVAVLLAWPVLLMTAVWVKAAWRGWLIAGFATVLGAVTFLSWHESSKLALLASCAVFALTWLNARIAFPLVVAGWIVMTVAVLPVAIVAFESRLYEASWIQETGRARLILWGTTAQRVLDAPILGIGAGAGRVLDDQVKDRATELPGQPFALRTGAHQHNIYLQTWYELGALGVLLLTAAGLALLTALRRQTGVLQSYLYAAFTAGAVMAGVSYGLWQAWFQATFGLMAVITMMAMAEQRTGANRDP